ncbi:hypothetical protein [Gloeobacter kilaueensis]|uniref:hypothetical protein n=1 Tax=Gloeobacter kilaueensis TaxID=1416614 RepID=UPI00040A4B73|nr:hypothetical protein [Gloeobacter kilaueensis]
MRLFAYEQAAIEQAARADRAADEQAAISSVLSADAHRRFIAHLEDLWSRD